MKRDWDLVRKTLLAVEALGDARGVVESIDGVDSENLSHHLRLLIEAGLMHGDCSQGLDGPLRCYATSLTWDGHEFLDKIRADTMWNKVKTIGREKGLTLSFDVIKAAATYAITEALKR